MRKKDALCDVRLMASVLVFCSINTLFLLLASFNDLLPLTLNSHLFLLPPFFLIFPLHFQISSIFFFMNTGLFNKLIWKLQLNIAFAFSNSEM